MSGLMPENVTIDGQPVSPTVPPPAALIAEPGSSPAGDGAADPNAKPAEPKFFIAGDGTPAAPMMMRKMIDDANKVVHVIDGLGRRIVVRRPNAIDRLEFSMLMGSEHAANDPVMSLAMVVAAVVELNGEARPQINAGVTLKLWLQKLDMIGIVAVREAVATLNPRLTEEQHKAAVGN